MKTKKNSDTASVGVCITLLLLLVLFVLISGMEAVSETEPQADGNNSKDDEEGIHSNYA